MALKTSLIIAGDASGAQAALSSVDRGMESNKAQAEAMAKAFANADVAVTKLAGAQTLAKRETEATKAAFAAGEITLEQYNRELLQTKSALSLVEAEHRAAMTALKQNSQTLDANTVSLGQQRAGYQNFGRQVQDVAVMLQSGANIGTIVALQGGQIADAVSQMGGRFAGLATFLSGPWGAAVFLGASVLIDNLIPALFDTGDAADEANADVIHLSGGIAELQANATIAANALVKLREEMGQTSKASEIADDATKTLVLGMGQLARINRDIRSSEETINQFSRTFGGAEVVEAEYQRLASLEKQKGKVEQEIAKARQQLNELRSLGDVAPIQRAAEDHNNARPKTDRSRRKGPSATTMAELGEDTAKKIAGIRDQFSDLPSGVERSNKAMAELNDIANDIVRKNLPQSLLGDVEKAKQSVQDSLIQPFNEYLQKAREAEQIDVLLAAGREDEAEALKVVLALQQRMGPLNQEQLDTVLETVRAERQRSEELQRQQEMMGYYLDATRSVRGEIEAILAGQGKLSNFKTIFKQLQARVLTEQIFGPALRGLEDYVKHDTFGPAVDRLSGSTDRASTAVSGLATSVSDALARINGATATAPAIGTAAVADAPFLDALKQLQSDFDDAFPGDIIVERTKQQLNSVTGLSPSAFFEEMFRRTTDPLLKGLDEALGVKFFAGLQNVLSGAISGYLTAGPAGGVLGALKEIPNLPSGIAKKLDGALKGAQTGTMAAGIMKSIGIKTSTTGAQIGGAIGSFIPIPGGDIIGSILGGVIGGMFKKAKWGTSVVTGQGEGDISTKGNKAAYRKNSEGAGGSVQDMIAQIAQQLGGDDTGAYSVSIGQYKGKWRVSTTGRSGKLKGGSGRSDVKDFGKEGGEEAVMFAALDAISDGAIKGISAAVQKALKSSTDLNKAVQEAMKVQDVELSIGGIGAELEKAFKDFERQAQERLRIAKQYSFDVVAIEQRNAEDRLKLTKQLLDEQVGSLQNLIDEMTSGSLFEGSAVDQRTALLGQVAQAREAAAKGEEGAADKLASLLEQLNSVSRDAYGTTGGFASDRELILDAARDTITKANQRVTEAQKASDPALATTNATLDEIADQNTRTLSAIGVSNDWLAKIAAQGGKADWSSLIAAAKTVL